MRRFLPGGGGGGGGGGGEPSSSSSSHGGDQHAAAGSNDGGLRYGGGDISLGRGHDQQLHHQAQFRGAGGEAEMKGRDDGGADLLARHSSSPAGFFSNLMVDDGSRAGAAAGGAEAHRSGTKMKSQLGFTAGGPHSASHLSRISEGAALFPGAAAAGHSHSGGSGGEHGAVSRSFSAGGGGGAGGFSIVGPWDESRDIIGTLDIGGYESQFSGMASPSSLELAGMDKYMQAQQQQDQVAFKVRAKRGCATHPRSIAERERRTRISEKLRKLQDLVPNMDKVEQTSTSDMLDLAVEHIKGLQSQLQAMKHEQDKCTCCSKP
ncbi:transcription factor bHLH128 [Brachypodium distachyon]|uniref:transcription factor bHLH128 n=1 Tax=Brachypodium distachyon TaxID=15368 RepID=UPI00052FF2E7|nr:transcription factor bHLH128 [Brachypodium distachyon]|eukprot:XP_010235663.1 transcription factor bHLH128 [Brachypodium distachyon]